MNNSTTTFTVVNITEGLYYKFKVSATNILGEGPLSDVFVVYISDLPEVMAPVQTSVVGTKVVIEWQQPDDNADPILSYEIMFIAKYGSLVQINDCSGQNPAVLSCQVEMSKVIAATGLQRGDLI